MPAQSPSVPVRIHLLALPETTPATLFSLYELFAAVGVAWRELTGEAVDVRRMEPRIVGGARSGPPGGPAIAPQTALADAGRADVVIVSDLALAPDDDPRGRWRDEAAWTRERFEAGAMICSVCTGSVFLAETGLLDGLEATTHWGATHFFAAHYPEVRLRPERILCPAGQAHRIVTGGGVGAWADLALYLVARFCGPAEAVRMAKVFLLGDRSEGQLPFAGPRRAARHGDAIIGRCQEWLAEHYREPSPVARMAERSGLAERTFKRRFRAATGYTPIDYVQALRVEEAKQMLETTDEPTDAVAHLVGYDDPAFFRRLFRRLTGVTPARYRQRFRQVRPSREAIA